MVLYYGLLALETANSIMTSSIKSKRTQKLPRQNPTEKISSSSNSWIYTADLKKRFEERYGDYCYIFVPVYINGKTSHYNHSTTTVIPPKCDGENAWMYSKSFRDHICYSTLKVSSSANCVSNQLDLHDQLPRKKLSKIKFFKQISSSKPDTSSSSFNIINHSDHENHSRSIIKHNSSRPLQTSDDDKTFVNTTINNHKSKTHNNKLTRLRSFFFKSSSLLSTTQCHQTRASSSSSLCHRIPKI